MTHEEQMRIVAEYDGWVIKYDVQGIPCFAKGKMKAFLGDMQYKISLDWLNPVWVKVCSAFYDGQEKVNWSEPTPQEFQRFKTEYFNSICVNNIPAAFDVVVEAILFIQNNKQK